MTFFFVHPYDNYRGVRIWAAQCAHIIPHSLNSNIFKQYAVIEF